MPVNKSALLRHCSQASLPSHVPSPDAVMGWQAGDCFDCAQLLCSLLLGVGYDAYVVSGYAPKAVTLVDQTSDTMSTMLPPPPEPLAPEPEPKKYAVRPRKVLESSFLKKKEVCLCSSFLKECPVSFLCPRGVGRTDSPFSSQGVDRCRGFRACT